MSREKACAEYLKQQKVYERCMAEMWKKWRSYGKVTGKITLKNASKEERRAISGITGKQFLEETVSFSFAAFEQGLQKTRFAPVEMHRVLEAYFYKKLCSRQEEKKQTAAQKDQFWDKIGHNLQEKSGKTKPMGAKWLKELRDEKRYGFQILMREYEKDEKQAELLAYQVGRAVSWLEEWKMQKEEYPLAVAAAKISGNPHYFDRNTTAGTLLVHAICWYAKADFPENTYQWRELLQQVGLLPDTISSIVHAYGLRMKKQNIWHPSYDAFCRLREPYVITMENLKGVTEVQPLGKRVYVVENEMVFSYLVDQVQRENYTLLCTSGQPRFVALQLISMILQTGVPVFYSGDIDPDGIGIADRLWQRFGEGIHFWRMTPEDYEKSLSGEMFGEKGNAKLEHICQMELKKTAERMRNKQRAGYQENILQELLEDMEETESGG